MIISNLFKTKFDELNTKYCIRNRKINMADMFYFVVNKNANNYSYDLTNAHIMNNSMFTKNVTSQSIFKKYKSIDVNDINNLNIDLLNHIYYPADKNKIRFIAVDGSQLNIIKNIISKNEFCLSNSKQYRTCLLSSLFDVDLNIPINYFVTNDHNERNALIHQLKYLHKNDVVIGDR